MAEQPLPRLGRRHRPSSSRALERLQAGCRSSVAICWLIADWESPSSFTGPDEQAGLHDGLEGRQVPDLDPHQAMTDP